MLSGLPDGKAADNIEDVRGTGLPRVEVDALRLSRRRRLMRSFNVRRLLFGVGEPGSDCVGAACSSADSGSEASLLRFTTVAIFCCAWLLIVLMRYEAAYVLPSLQMDWGL